jgi:hypothetical protein
MICFRAVDAAQADTLRAGVVQDFDGVAVEDGNNGADELGECSQWVEQEQKQADQVSHLSPPASLLLRHNLILS